MNISKDTLYPFLIYSRPFPYNESVKIYPVTMDKILEFQVLQSALTIRKDSTFTEKQVIKMTYYDFLKFCFQNVEFALKYKMPFLTEAYAYMWQLLNIVCRTEVEINEKTQNFIINGFEITDREFNDIRRIIILQNDIDFDVDEFIHYDTEQALKKAVERDNQLKNDKSSIEDYIDSLVVALHMSESEIMNMTIRKFWRYIRRFNLHEDYSTRRIGECSGTVKFKEPIKHWMTSLNDNGRYENVKMNEAELGKIAG